MGYKQNFDVVDIVRQINSMVYDCNDPGLTGFVNWPIKQDLYKIKWILEDGLRRCSTFGGEAEWLKEQEQKKIMGILRDEM
jgi:hypothetical protein